MATRTFHLQAVQRAVSDNQDDIIWAAYKNAWSDGVAPPMLPDVFDRIFYDSDRAREACRLVAQTHAARETLHGTALQLPTDLGDSAVLSVVCAVLAPEELEIAWAGSRGNRHAEERTQLASRVVGALIRWAGREWVRQRALSWWAHADLLEEEREALLDALDEGEVLTGPLIAALGPLAQQRPRLRRTLPTDVSVRISAATPDLERTLGALLDPIRIPADVRDGNLRPEESGRCFGPLWPPSMFEAILRDLRHTHPFWQEFANAMQRASQPGATPPSFTWSSATAGNVLFAVPLARLFHMRLILEAPALAHALARPENHLVPAVLLHVLGQDAVTYGPELRVHQDVERRWRARWAEMNGEAISVLLLEDALRLDLTTLTRIPERPDTETPDFMAETREGERIVFESKGATDVRTHRRQRRKALVQLGKLAVAAGCRVSGRRVGRRGRAQWKQPGRAFACCLYAAIQGARASSSLHLADPPFGFDELFHEGWQTHARRRHYAAVAEAAGLFELADELLQRHPLGERGRRADVETFVLGEEQERNSGARFRGTSVWLAEMALRLRHPRPGVFDGVRMFIGIEEGVYQSLERGDVTGPSVERWQGRLAPGTAALPAKGRAAGARGVYSVLSNGAFMAFEVSESSRSSGEERPRPPSRKMLIHVSE